LQAVAKTVASKFPSSSRTKYENLAKELRVPYWDWAKNVPTSETIMPASFTTPKIGVTFPNGSVAQIENPLFDYNFHPLDNKQINGTVSENSTCSISLTTQLTFYDRAVNEPAQTDALEACPLSVITRRRQSVNQSQMEAF
jgi:hypothetical protein